MKLSTSFIPCLLVLELRFLSLLHQLTAKFSVITLLGILGHAQVVTS
jgi:hypothetical protein